MTQLLTPTTETNKITKRITKVFSNGNSTAVRLPYEMAARHGLDTTDEAPIYVLCEDLPSGILIKRLNEEALH